VVGRGEQRPRRPHQGRRCPATDEEGGVGCRR
jgi:hypothetical protein